MDFEDILNDVGSFGRYQKLLLFAMCPCFIIIPCFSMSMIFMSNTPDHWCYVRDVAESNLSLEEQKLLIRPPKDSSCSMYDIDYSQILLTSNWTVNSSWPTKPCDKGWLYDKSDYEATAVTRWNMVCSDSYYTSLVISLIFVGNLFGTPLYGFLSDKVGRKKVFFALAVLIAGTEIFSTLSPNFTLFLVLRALNGTAMVSVYVAAYLIFMELVDPAYRTRINGIGMMCWSTGLCLLPLLAWLTGNWVHLSIVMSSAALAFLLYLKLLPESPRWLITKGRYDEAAAILKDISKRNGRSAHEGNQLLQKIHKLSEKIKVQKSEEETQSPLDLLRYPLLRKRFLLVTICWSCNSLPYYGLQVNVKNLAGSEFLNYFLISVVEIPAHSLAWFCMDRLGRRWCSVFAFIITATACLMPVILPKEYALVDVVSSLVAKASSSIAFMSVYQQCPELLPTSLRGIGMGLSSTIGTGTALLVPYIVYLGTYGKSIPFLVFCIVPFFSAICASFLPETLNRNLPQTVTDAENFEKDFKFFSLSRDKKRKTEDVLEFSVKSPAAFFTPLGKCVIFDDPCRLVQVQPRKTSLPFFPACTLHL